MKYLVIVLAAFATAQSASAAPIGAEITATPLRSFQDSPFAAAPVGLKFEPSGLIPLTTGNAV